MQVATIDRSGSWQHTPCSNCDLYHEQVGKEQVGRVVVVVFLIARLHTLTHTLKVASYHLFVNIDNAKVERSDLKGRIEEKATTNANIIICMNAKTLFYISSYLHHDVLGI